MKWFVKPLLVGAACLGIGADAIAQGPAPAQGPVPLGPAARRESPPAVPAATYTITLHARHACVTPHTKKLARVDGGFIDVASPSPQGLIITATGTPAASSYEFTSPAPPGLIVTMTGTAAASSYLGCTGVATAEFELAQEFEITCSDPSVSMVALTLDSALVGFVRSKGHAGAAVRVAEVSVTPEGWDGTPLSLWYPPFGVTGKQGRLCNQHVPPVQDMPMPVGRYVLSARFAIDTQASGVCDDHSVADFSPDTALPADWVRNRDPFQGVSKKAFGFTCTLSVAAPSASALPQPGHLSGSRPLGPNATNSAPRAPLDARTRRTSS
jgi:hypothetical protein